MLVVLENLSIDHWECIEWVKKYKTSLHRIAITRKRKEKSTIYARQYWEQRNYFAERRRKYYGGFSHYWKVQTNILYISPRKYVLFECTHKPARPGSVRGDEAPWGRIHERTISLRFLGIILRVLRLEVSYTMFQTSFKPLLLMGGGGEVGGGG